MERLAVLCLVTAALAGGARAAPPTEYEMKAAFLYKFARFVEWPDRVFPDGAARLVIGVAGSDPFGGALETMVAQKTVAGRRMALRRLRLDDVAGARGCHVLFVGGGDGAGAQRLLAGLRDAPVLTVGDSLEFARAGGVIGFYIEDERIRLAINTGAASQAGLEVSSELLKVSRIVKP